VIFPLCSVAGVASIATSALLTTAKLPGLMLRPASRWHLQQNIEPVGNS